MRRHLSVSEVARRLKARPRDISDLFYRRRLRDDLCPIVAGRRLIPEDYVEIIAVQLRRAGRPCGLAGRPAMLLTGETAPVPDGEIRFRGQDIQQLLEPQPHGGACV